MWVVLSNFVFHGDALLEFVKIYFNEKFIVKESEDLLSVSQLEYFLFFMTALFWIIHFFARMIQRLC